MSASQILAYGDGPSQNDNQTRYYAVSGCIDSASESATEADRQVTWRESGTAANLFLRVLTNTCTVTSVFVLRVNGASSALTLNVTADATGEFEDITHAVSLADGDEVCYQLAIPTEAGTNSMACSVTGMTFTASSNTATVVTTPESTNVGTASATRYFSVVASPATATEAAATCALEGTDGFVVSNLFVYVSANARTNNTVFVSRNNGFDGNLTVTFGSTETGIKEDTSNSDTIIGGYCLKATTGAGTETITIQQRAVTLTSMRTFTMIGNTLSGAYAPVAGVTNYFHCGKLAAATTTEASAQLLSRITCTLRDLQVEVSANTVTTSATTIKSRINGADGNQIVSFAAAETGAKSDASNTDAIMAGSSRYCLQVIVPATTGAITFRNAALFGESAAGVGAQRRLILNQSVSRASIH